MNSITRFEELVGIIERLRGSEGCPWDRRQTHASLRESLLSESYEVLEALDEADAPRLCEELGDLLMQIVLQARIAAECGEFDLGDVISGINTKLVQRHPHIFGSAKAVTAEEVAQNWEELKGKERPAGASMLDSVPGGMPALAHSLEVQDRVARVGFDWENVDGVIDKLAEEIGELREAGSPADREREFGDVLFTLVNAARRMGVDSEAALRGANRRFRRRFACMEEICRRRGLDLARLTFDEQNALWEEAKEACRTEDNCA